MDKSVHYLKMETEATTTTTTKHINCEILDMKNLGKLTEATDATVANRIREMEDRILGINFTIEEIDSSIKNC